MRCLLSLPESIVACILMNWLEIRSVTRLDSAACNGNDRRILLAMLRSKVFVWPSLWRLPSRSSTERKHLQLDWIIRRSVKVSSFAYMMSEETDNCQWTKKLLEVIEGPALRNLKLKKSSGRYSSRPYWPSGLISGIASACHRVQQLHISSNQGPSEAEPIILANASCLQKLNLSFVHDKLDLPANVKLPSLRQLVLRGTRAHNCRSIASSALFLTHLYLDECSLESVLPLLWNSNLQHLGLEFCRDVSDPELCELATRLPQLRSLSLEAILNTTDDSVVAFAQHCPQLEAVMLIGNYGAKAVMAVARLIGPRLRHLCYEVRCELSSELQDALTALAQRSRHLISVSFFDDAGKVPEQLDALIQNQPYLTHLDISCSTVNLSVWKAIASLGSQLTVLNLSDVDDQDKTNEGFLLMVEKCTSLRRIWVGTIDSVEKYQLTETAKRLWRMRVPKLEIVGGYEKNLPYWARLWW